MSNKPRIRRFGAFYFATRPVTGVMGQGKTIDEAYADLLLRELAIKQAKFITDTQNHQMKLSQEFILEAEREKEKADAEAFMQRIYDEAEATQRAIKILYGLRCLVLFAIVLYLYFTRN